MKTKMKLAHEYMQNTLNLLRKHDIPYDFESLIEESYDYAEAMIAEEDKRTNQIQEEWQPDWSKAPEWANWWYVTNKNNPKWCSKKPYQDGCDWFVGSNETYSLYNAPSFGYQGDWKDSLRERPE